MLDLKLRGQEREAWRRQQESSLLKSVAANLPSLEDLLLRYSDHWHYEDPIYRFYHQSFKVYGLQAGTQEIVTTLQSLAAALPLNKWFMEIAQQGTGKEFSLQDNENWTAITRPIVEAFLHARFFLEMICKYGKELKEPPDAIPSGWAAVLYLYNLR